jgi:hypothetical protein
LVSRSSDLGVVYSPRRTCSRHFPPGDVLLRAPCVVLASVGDHRERRRRLASHHRRQSRCGWRRPVSTPAVPVQVVVREGVQQQDVRCQHVLHSALSFGGSALVPVVPLRVAMVVQHVQEGILVQRKAQPVRQGKREEELLSADQDGHKDANEGAPRGIAAGTRRWPSRLGPSRSPSGSKGAVHFPAAPRPRPGALPRRCHPRQRRPKWLRTRSERRPRALRSCRLERRHPPTRT